MALDDGGLTAGIASALATVHTSSTDTKAALASAITTYAAGAQLSTPGTGLAAPSGPVTGSATGTVTFTASALTSGLDTLFSSGNTRPGAASKLAAAISAYGATASASVPAAGLGSTAGPLVGTSTSSTATFGDSALASSLASLWAQDNSAAFAAAGMSAAIATYFKSGRLSVPSSYTAPMPTPPPPTGPVTGTATGSII
jgi:hypothetical protein